MSKVWETTLISELPVWEGPLLQYYSPLRTHNQNLTLTLILNTIYTWSSHARVRYANSDKSEYLSFIMCHSLTHCYLRKLLG